MEHRSRSTILRRREALGAVLGLGSVALLAACGPAANGVTVVMDNTGSATSGVAARPTAISASAVTAATSPSAPATAAAAGAATTASTNASGAPAVTAAEIKIVDAGARLPSESATLHWVQSGPGPKGVFQAQFFQAYHAAHGNVTIDFQELPWASISQILPLGIQNGNAPDVFQLPPAISNGQAVAQGWVAPLDDVIPNLDAWRKSFPPGAFVEGITVFGGKVYSFPLSSNKRYDTLTLYNRKAMEQAGFDPAATPFTWDTFRQAAKKLTVQGQGQYYGLLLEGKDTSRFAAWVTGLAQMAGAAGGEMNWATGEYNYTTPQYQAAIELLLAIKNDGSVYPGSLALNAQQARALIPQGKAAMILQGPWNIPQWQQASPAFSFGVASQPLPNSGTPLPRTYDPGGSNLYFLYSKSKLGAVAGDLFYQLGTLPIQTQFATVDGISDPAMFPQALQQAKLDPLQQKAAALFDQQLRLAPSPQVRNPDVAKALEELRHLTPDFGQTVQGIYTGQLTDAKQAMQSLLDRANTELDRAIKAAQAKGAKVTRDDWKFPNWDPTKDYGDAQYAALAAH